jgi:hypothetical protein
MNIVQRSTRLMADLFAAFYVATCFLRYSWSTSSEHTIVFSRGAFRRDIPALGRDTLLIDIKGEWLKRCFRLTLPGGWFEQLICLGYREELRKAFRLTIRVFRYFLETRKARILFGGVDYFEVAIFAERGFYSPQTRIVAVFHENYAIEFVKNVTRALYENVHNGFLFDELYAYGPSAFDILERFARDPHGPRPMVMPRLAQMENETAFSKRLLELNGTSFSNSVLLLAFPGTDYFAPLCFTATLLELAKLGAGGVIRPIVKFKNRSAADEALRHTGHLGKHIEWVYDGSVETLVWRAGYTVVFNSISLYEALLGPTIIVVPAYLDSLHDENILQETEKSVFDLVGPIRSVVFAGSLAELSAVVGSMRLNEIKELVSSERAARKALVNRKFYLTADESTALRRDHADGAGEE